MTHPGESLYDEPGSRTGQAWLRTALATMGACALMVRGMWMADASWWLIALIACCGACVAGVAAYRGRMARTTPRSAVPLALVASVTVAVCVVCAVGAVELNQ